MICNPSTAVDSGKCLLSYTAAMALTSSALNIETRGRILKLLLQGLDLGNTTTITTAERKFTLQKSLGIWFHINATDGDDD